MRKSKSPTPESQALAQAEEEVRRLKQEVEDLKRSNFILKELSAFFSKDRPEADSGRSERSGAKRSRKKRE